MPSFVTPNPAPLLLGANAIIMEEAEAVGAKTFISVAQNTNGAIVRYLILCYGLDVLVMAHTSAPASIAGHAGHVIFKSQDTAYWLDGPKNLYLPPGIGLFAWKNTANSGNVYGGFDLLP